MQKPTSGTRAAIAWAEGEQGAAPELDAAFRADQENLTALVLAGAAASIDGTVLTSAAEFDCD